MSNPDDELAKSFFIGGCLIPLMIVVVVVFLIATVVKVWMG